MREVYKLIIYFLEGLVVGTILCVFYFSISWNWQQLQESPNFIDESHLNSKHNRSIPARKTAKPIAKSIKKNTNFSKPIFIEDDSLLVHSKSELDAIKSRRAEIYIKFFQAKIDSLKKLNPVLKATITSHSSPQSRKIVQQRAAKAHPTSPLQTFKEDHEENLQAILQRLYPVSIAFSTPQTMFVGESQLITLILDPSHTPDQTKRTLAGSLKTTLIPDQRPQTLTADSIQVTNVVDAQLSGADFIISPITHSTQLVKKNGITQWNWDVLPQSEESHLLHLVINTKIRLGEESEFLELQTYHRSIEVKVTLGKRISRFAEKYSGVLPFIFGTASIFSIYGWLKEWFSSRNPAPTNPTLPPVKPRPAIAPKRGRGQKQPPRTPESE